MQSDLTFRDDISADRLGQSAHSEEVGRYTAVHFVGRSSSSMIHQNGQSLPQHDPVMELNGLEGKREAIIPNYSKIRKGNKKKKKKKKRMDEWIGVKVSSTHAMPIASTSLMAAGVEKKKKKKNCATARTPRAI